MFLGLILMFLGAVVLILRFWATGIIFNKRDPLTTIPTSISVLGFVLMIAAVPFTQSVTWTQTPANTVTVVHTDSTSHTSEQYRYLCTYDNQFAHLVLGPCGYADTPPTQ